MKTLTRVHSGEVRAPDDTPGTFEAVVLSYNTLDDYRTVFDPGCFARSLGERLPAITWGHSWADPIGRWVDYTDTDDTLTLVGELDDFEAVPRAKQAYAQLRSGTIRDFSVGFRPDKENGTRMVEDVEHFVRATLDEAALVLVGAVPGTKLVSVRSAGNVREVSVDTLVALAKKIDAGELSQEQGQAALDLAAGVHIQPGATVSATIPAPATPTELAEVTDTIDQADEALDALGL